MLREKADWLLTLACTPATGAPDPAIGSRGIESRKPIVAETVDFPDAVPGGESATWCRMTSEPIRDPVSDHLLTPQNAALVVIDYQPSQVQTVTSMDRELLIDNIVSVARLAETFDLPVVLSTINVANGQKPTIPELRAVLSDSPEIDRTSINSWEDIEFRRAIEATGRKKLVMAALWTEVCLAFPALDAMREGFEVYPVVDAVGGTSVEAHRAGLERIVQAGGQPITWCRWRASSSGTGIGSTRWLTSSTSCSPVVCSRASERSTGVRLSVNGADVDVDDRHGATPLLWAPGRTRGCMGRRSVATPASAPPARC
jgi:nicotinamidase-related amidase